jgi:peroxiredoxin
MKERAEEKGFKFPYLFDESQKMGHDYGAAVTPHAFVVGKEGKLVYIGAIDDNMSAKKVKKHYVRDALDAILADKEPPQPKTKAFGCGIAYEN